MDENKFEDIQGGLLDSLDEMLSAKSQSADKPEAKENVADEKSVSQEKKSKRKSSKSEKRKLTKSLSFICTSTRNTVCWTDLQELRKARNLRFWTRAKNWVCPVAR